MPIAATPITFQDIFFRGGYSLGYFQSALAEYLQVKNCFLVGSGTLALYLILKAAMRISDRKEVILPAYTAHSLVLPIKRLGLKIRLCDISLENFNLDVDFLKTQVSQNTLCIVAVHLFGIPCDIENINKIANREEIFVIEDAAQALGTTINNKMAGTFSDMGFFSFNRGKNLPTYSGGCIVTDEEDLADMLKKDIDSLKKPNMIYRINSRIKLSGLRLAAKPGFYGLFYPLLKHFKNNAVATDFSLDKYTVFQAGTGLALLKRIDEYNERRYQNSMALIKGLKDMDRIILPKIPENIRPAFNRFPVIFKDMSLKEKIENKLWNHGFETSRMYLKPVDEGFPCATYFAEHLLTVPIHPLVKAQDVQKMINIFKELE